MKNTALAGFLASGALLLAAGTMTLTAQAANVNMYRMYNKNSGEHFYTSAANERDSLVTAGWTYEGIGWTAPETSSSPVYRLYNKNNGDHHYTRSTNERDYLVAQGWKYEQIGWYSDDAEGVPLYRQYNKNAKTGSHNYTTSKKENDYLVSLGWSQEGIGWYGVKGTTYEPVSEGLDQLDRAELANRTVHVSFAKTDVTKTQFGPVLMVKVYTEDRFKESDISALQIGDYLKIQGKAVRVESVSVDSSDSGLIHINGGIDEKGGFDLRKDASDGYYHIVGSSDAISYYQVGSDKIRLIASDDFTFTDDYDKDKEVIYNGSGFLSGISSMEGTFTANNTTITFDSDGYVSAMKREYTP